MAKKNKVSEREKEIMVNLAKAGVTSKTIALAFGVPTQEVAAYKAWDTMRNER
jgi:FixJ family two-component response regulator